MRNWYWSGRSFKSVCSKKLCHIYYHHKDCYLSKVSQILGVQVLSAHLVYHVYLHNTSNEIRLVATIKWEALAYKTCEQIVSTMLDTEILTILRPLRNKSTSIFPIKLLMTVMKPARWKTSWPGCQWHWVSWTPSSRSRTSTTLGSSWGTYF